MLPPRISGHCYTPIVKRDHPARAAPLVAVLLELELTVRLRTTGRSARILHSIHLRVANPATVDHLLVGWCSVQVLINHWSVSGWQNPVTALFTALVELSIFERPRVLASPQIFCGAYPTPLRQLTNGLCTPEPSVQGLSPCRRIDLSSNYCCGLTSYHSVTIEQQ